MRTEADEDPSTHKRATGRDAQTQGNSKRQRTGIVRVYCNGCFDLTHYGHADCIRQAKLLGDYLVVAVHSDAEIAKHRAPPIMTERERLTVVRAIKWVDEAHLGSSFELDTACLDKHDCDFAVHGNSERKDVFRRLEAAGRYRECQRTAGVSTTELVERMKLMTKTHHIPCHHLPRDVNAKSASATFSSRGSTCLDAPQFLPTSRSILLFADGKEPQPGDKIVYCPGAFDLFHAGHVRFLEKARELGDYLIVGLHSDKDVNSYDGDNYPIMNLHERTLCVLACKYVSEVVIGAPLQVTSELLDHFQVDIVVHGKTQQRYHEGTNLYEEPKNRGILRVTDSGSGLSTAAIVARVTKKR